MNMEIVKLMNKHKMKIRIYKYMFISMAVLAVLCIAIGIIIGNKFLPFLGMLLISGPLVALINPLAKGY